MLFALWLHSKPWAVMFTVKLIIYFISSCIYVSLTGSALLMSYGNDATDIGG